MYPKEAECEGRLEIIDRMSNALIKERIEINRKISELEFERETLVRLIRLSSHSGVTISNETTSHLFAGGCKKPPVPFNENEIYY